MVLKASNRSRNTRMDGPPPAQLCHSSSISTSKVVSTQNTNLTETGWDNLLPSGFLTAAVQPLSQRPSLKRDRTIDIHWIQENGTSSLRKRCTTAPFKAGGITLSLKEADTIDLIRNHLLVIIFVEANCTETVNTVWNLGWFGKDKQI